MKRIAALVLALLMVPGIGFAEEYVPRGKSIGITKSEWIKRYEAVPEAIAQQKTDVFLVNAGVQDFRTVYYATPLEQVNFYVMCEDTTDEVFAVLTTIDFSHLHDEYQLGEKIGKFTTESRTRMAYATDPDISPDDLSACLNLMDVDALTKGADFSHTFDVGANRYVCSLNAGTLSYGVRSTDVFTSEADFMQYREDTTK